MANNTRLVDNYKTVLASPPKNMTGAAMTAKWVSLKNYNHWTGLIITGSWAASSAAVTLLQATAVAGTGSKALAFSWVAISGTDPSDTYATGTPPALTAVVANTFNVDMASCVYQVEVDAASLDVSNGFDCISFAIASPGANADLYAVLYILGGARYHQIALPTSLLD